MERVRSDGSTKEVEGAMDRQAAALEESQTAFVANRIIYQSHKVTHAQRKEKENMWKSKRRKRECLGDSELIGSHWTSSNRPTVLLPCRKFDLL